jgi:hypothetical protein
MENEPLYTINDSTLTISDSEAFGFEGCDLYNEQFSIVEDTYLRARRSYSINWLVIEEKSTGRFFAREYSLHEDNGFEWEPGYGVNMSTNWHEVFATPVTYLIYR